MSETSNLAQVEHRPSTPWMVGCIRTGGSALPHPMTARDIAADARFATGMFALMGIGAGSTVLFTCASSEYAQFWPFEQALETLGACVAVADNSPFDAGRSEMFMRRLSVDLAFGIGSEIVDGMAMMKLDVATAFSPAKLICARTAAADRLATLGFSPWRMVAFGPAFAFIAPDGTTYHDQDEWLFEAPAGELLITARQARGNQLKRFATGVRGGLDSAGALRFD